VPRRLASTNQLPPNGAQSIGAASSPEPKWRDSLDATKSSREWQNLQWKKWPNYDDWPDYLDVYESAAYLRICPKFIRQRLCIVVDKNDGNLAEIPHLRVGAVWRIKKQHFEQFGAMGYPPTQATVQRNQPLITQVDNLAGLAEFIPSRPLPKPGSESASHSRACRENFQNELWARWPREENWPGYLDVNEAAAFLRISPKSIRLKLQIKQTVGRTRPPELPHHRLGRIYRIRKEVLIAANAVKTWTNQFDYGDHEFASCTACGSISIQPTVSLHPSVDARRR